MTDHTPFLATIARNPADMGPRLVFADWLEERGACDRAEFVRVQCEMAEMRLAGMPAVPLADGDPDAILAHWTKLNRRADALLAANELSWFLEFGFPKPWCGSYTDRCGLAAHAGGPCARHRLKFAWHRGFVSQVKCRLADWRGGLCPKCVHESNVRRIRRCPTCHGTGRTPGLGAVLLRRAPIEQVVVTDRQPYASIETPQYCWFSPDNGRPSFLPDGVFDALGDFCEIGDDLGPDQDISVKYYKSADAARAALSDALIKLAREQMEPEPKLIDAGANL